MCQNVMIITGFVGISRNRTMMKSDEMKHEMTSFNTMGLNRNVLFQTHLLFVAIYGLMWSSFNIRWYWSVWKSLITTYPTYLVMFLNNLFSQQNVKNRVICVWGGGKVLAKLRNYSFITENGSNCFAKIPVKAVFLHRVEVMYHLHCTFSSLFYFQFVTYKKAFQ